MQFYMSFFPYYFTDPYQTLGPLSSQLANPGMNLNQCKFKQEDINEAFTLWDT